MNKEQVTNFIKGLQTKVTKHSPEILTAMGIAGMVTTVVLAVKATPKALEKIEEAEQEKGEELTPVETVKTAWKPYIPVAATGVASVACLLGAHSVHTKRYTALTAAYHLSTTAFSEYRDKVIETIGEKKEKVVHDNIAKEELKKNPVSQQQVFLTKRGTTLFFDPLSGRYFTSDIDRIRRARDELNYKMTGGMEMYVSLNEFYDAIELPRIDLGNTIGWTVNKGGMIDIHFSAQFVEDEDTTCTVIEHLVPPKYGFDKYF